MNIITENGQTVFDIALQYCGSIEAAFDIAALNDIEVTSSPTVGTELKAPDTVNRNVVGYYKHNEIKPSTAFISTNIV